MKSEKQYQAKQRQIDDYNAINTQNVRWARKNDYIEEGEEIIYDLTLEFKTSGVMRALTYWDKSQRDDMYDQIMSDSGLI